MRALPHIFMRCPSCVLEFRTAAWRVVPGSEMTCVHCEHRWTLSAETHSGQILTAQLACERFDGRKDRLRRLWYSPDPRPAVDPRQATTELRALLDRMRRYDADTASPESKSKLAGKQ